MLEQSGKSFGNAWILWYIYCKCSIPFAIYMHFFLTDRWSSQSHFHQTLKWSFMCCNIRQDFLLKPRQWAMHPLNISNNQSKCLQVFQGSVRLRKNASSDAGVFISKLSLSGPTYTLEMFLCPSTYSNTNLIVNI